MNAAAWRRLASPGVENRQDGMNFPPDLQSQSGLMDPAEVVHNMCTSHTLVSVRGLENHPAPVCVLNMPGG